MSIAVYDLRLGTSYTEAVSFDLDQFREHLKKARKALAGGRDHFAEKVGVNKTTIQNAENGPDIPKIDTVAKLVEGMGLTLSSFFAEIEAGATSSLHTTPLAVDNSVHPRRRGIQPVQESPNVAGVPASAPFRTITPDDFERAVQAIMRGLRATETPNRRAADHPVQQPHKPAHRRRRG